MLLVTPIRVATNDKTENKVLWIIHNSTLSMLSFCKMVQLLWKTVWCFSKFNNWTAILIYNPFWSIYPKELKAVSWRYYYHATWRHNAQQPRGGSNSDVWQKNGQIKWDISFTTESNAALKRNADSVTHCNMDGPWKGTLCFIVEIIIQKNKVL